MTEQESEQIDLGKFDETDLRQLQIKLMVGFGALMGFRGNDEHTLLLFSQIGTGKFPDNHALYPGMEWWGLTHFSQDKTMKLSTANSWVRSNGEALGRFPVLFDGITGDIAMDFGGAIKRYVQHFPPECRTGRFYKRLLSHGRSFSLQQVIGRETVKKMIREGYAILGIARWATLRPHCLRQHFTSILANDKSINDAEKLAACRHNSIKTNQKYQHRGQDQECRRLNALLPAATSMSTVVIKPFGPEKPAPQPPKPYSRAIIVPEPVPHPQPAYVQQPETHPHPAYVHMQHSPVSPAISTYTHHSTRTVSEYARHTRTTSSTMPSPEFVTYSRTPTHARRSNRSTMPSPEFVPSTSSPYSVSSHRSSRPNNDYSIYTQQQVDGLYHDMEQLRRTRAQANNDLDNMKRTASDRESEISMLRSEVRSLQRDVQMSEFPYRDNVEEHNHLYNDYMRHEFQETNAQSRRRSWEAMNRWKRTKRDSETKRSRKSW